MRITKLSLILAVFIFGMAMAGCIATKPNGHISYAKQVYHDLTHRNNGYFNAEQRIIKVQQNIQNTRKDDYDKVLPIYTDRDPAAAKSYSSDLDEVIKKTSTVITNHRPSIYTPNSYFLVGVSYFLKGDFDNAVTTFRYVNTEFKHPFGAAKKPLTKEQKAKKKKKKKKKGPPMSASQQAAANAQEAIDKNGSGRSSGKHPMTALQKRQAEEAQHVQDSITAVQDSVANAQKKAEKAAKDALAKSKKDTLTEGAASEEEEGNKGGEDFWHFLKHEPIRPEAMIWLANTYTEMKKYKESEAVLTIIDADENFPSWLKKEVEIARANTLLQKKDYPQAIAPLSWLVEKNKKKHNKIRYQYILAQIYERQHNSSEALTQYKNVLDGHPDYVMAFHAKMSLARMAMNDNSMPTDEVVKMLKKLLNDPKNKEFYDQVYFALAELMLRDGNKKEAIGYYKKCIAASGSNTAQKSKAYLKIGELYFEEESYEAAEPYYDSSLTLLPKDDPKRPEVSTRTSVLKNLVTQVNIIHDCDSLLKLSSMSEREREQYVEDQIKKEADAKAEAAAEQKFLLSQNTPTSTTPVDRNAFYFDNPDAKAAGYNDFQKRWGERKLDDNWRRNDKSVVLSEENASAQDTTAVSDSASKKKLSEKEKMLKNIPTGDEEVKKTTGKIIDAYYMLGTIYNIELNNSPKALATFEELLKRYPTNKWEGETYYNLYLLYQKIANQEKADYYKNLVLTKFPDSKFAGIIRDPDYMKHQAQLSNALNDFYQSSYSYYEHGIYDSVINRKTYADSIYKNETKLKPQFDLLEAYAVGKSQDLRSYKDALQNLVKTYPSDSVSLAAKRILKYIETSKDSTVHIKNDMTRYEYSVEARHFFMIDIKTGDTTVKVPEVMKLVGDFDMANYNAQKLRPEPTMVPDGNIIVAVKSFDNLKKAKEYYDKFVASNVLAKFPKASIGLYMISDVNFNKVMANKEVNSYFDYYKIKYAQ